MQLKTEAIFRFVVGFVFWGTVGTLFSFAGKEIDFVRDVLPVLQERCIHCHGEDEQESGLRLDIRSKMLRGGDSGLAAVVPGDPKASYLIEVINHVDEDMAMPPDDDKMPEEEIQLLTRWVQQGATWPGQMEAVQEEQSDHWAFQSVVRPAVPTGSHAVAIESDNPNETANPIDQFLGRKLNQSGLTFSQAADPATLIRRASIVLTGIMPTPEQVSEFVANSSDDPDAAYLAMVDQLLGSPHFGERWAQHWLDVIRWAETNGSEANLYRKNAWIYRDYVTRSFNEDKLYDQFVREQIAGDSMGAGEATGFLVAGPHVPAATVGREPSAIRQARADRLDEVMQTVGASVMGVTIGCARCHNHKFDPVTIQDYYAMTAVFQDVEFGSRFPEFAANHPRRQRGGQLRSEIAEQRKLLQEFGGWEENWGAFRETHFQPVTTSAIRVRFKMPKVGLDELEVFGTEDRSVNLAHSRRGTKVTSNSEKGIDGRFPVVRLIDGEFGTMTWRAQVAQDTAQVDQASAQDTGAPDTGAPAEVDAQPWVRLDFKHPETIDRLRMSGNREYFYDTDYLTKKPNLARYEFDMDVMKDDGTWQPWVGTWHINKKLNQEHPSRPRILGKIQNSISLLAEQGPRPSFVGRFVRPVVTKVLLRGSPENPRDEVMPAGPSVFGGDLELTSAASGPKRREAFARWITSPENPLTARVMVNRIWHHVFGQGIVPTTSDFGKAGAPPSHPELLDWLASEFISPENTATETASTADGMNSPPPWSMKAMIRLMVTSAAFRQSSEPNENGISKDAGAALLWRFPPKRVEAEVIRDSVLQASGSLDPSIGGRSYRIHNEKKTYAQWQVLDNHSSKTWRRMLYQERMRRVDDQIFTAFDFPDCGQVRAKRPVSTTPLQALNLMNSDFVLEQSTLIAQRAQRDRPDASVDRAFQLLLGRLPSEDERNACETLAKEHDLSMVCRALINSNEFAFLP